MRRYWLAAALTTALLVSALLTGCGDDDIRNALRSANDVRLSEAGRLASRACQRAGDVIPGARGVFDNVSKAALDGDRSAAKSILNASLKIQVTQLETQARVALKACRAALG